MFIDQKTMGFRLGSITLFGRSLFTNVFKCQEFLEVILEDETERHEFGFCFLKSVKIEVERQLSSFLSAPLDDKNLYGCDKISKEVLDNV